MSDLCPLSYSHHTHTVARAHTHTHTHTHAQAQSAGNRGDDDSARNNERLSIGCSVGAVVFGVLGIIAIIGGIAGFYSYVLSF